MKNGLIYFILLCSACYPRVETHAVYQQEYFLNNLHIPIQLTSIDIVDKRELSFPTGTWKRLESGPSAGDRILNLPFDQKHKNAVHQVLKFNTLEQAPRKNSCLIELTKAELKKLPHKNNKHTLVILHMNVTFSSPTGSHKKDYTMRYITEIPIVRRGTYPDSYFLHALRTATYKALQEMNL